MKHYRILTCLLALLLAGMIGFSAIADTGLNVKDLAIQAAQEALNAAEAEVEKLLNITPATVTNAENALENKQEEQTLNAKAIATNASEIAAVEAELKDIKATIDAELVALDAQKATLEAGKNDPAFAPAALDAAIEAAEKAADDAQTELDKLAEKEAALKAAKANQEATAQNLADQDAALKTAVEETKTKADAVTAAESVVTTAKNALTDANSKLEEYKDDWLDAKGDVDEIVQLQAQIDAKEAEIERVAAEKKNSPEAIAKKAELDAKQAEYNSLSDWDLSKIKVGAELFALKNEYNELLDTQALEAELLGLRAKLAIYDIAGSEAAVAAKKAIFEAAEAAIPGLEAKVTEAENDLEQAKQEVAAAEAAQATAQEKLNAATTANNQALADIAIAEAALEAQKTAAAEKQTEAQEKAAELQALKDSNANKAELQAAAEKLYDDFMATYEAKKAEINAKDATLEAELAALEAEKAALAAKAVEIAAAIVELEQDIVDAKAAHAQAIEDAKAYVAELKQKLEDLLNDLDDVVVCTHPSMKLTVFGSEFCVLKALGSCIDSDTCCPNISTGTISSTIKGYIQSGDYAGLKSEAESLYSQLNALQGSPVASIVKGLVESAVDAKANEYLGAEKWAELKNLANQMMSAGELNGMIDGVVADLKGQVDSAINAALNGNPAALNALKAKIDELKSYFGNIDLDKVEIDASLVQRAKNILNSAKAEIEAMINAANDKIDREKIEAAINNAVAALRNVNHAEIKAAIEQFVSELKAKLEDKFSDAVSQGKAELEALIQSALNSDCAQHISNKVAALKAAVEAKLANIHVCEESAEVVAQEVKALIEACEAEILAYLEQKADDVCGKLPHFGLSESEVKTLIAKAVSALKELACNKLNSIHAIINEILSHTRVVMPAVAPTCSTIGWTEGLKCVCGYVLIAPEMIPATGNHIYVDGVCSCGAKDPNYVKPEVTPKPPVVTPEPPVVTPKPPVVTPETPVVPPMKMEYLYNNTMSSYGPTTRELVGGNDWYRVTPVDLSIDGVYTYDLIASNRYVVGTVTIKVEAGELTVTYAVTARPCTVKKEELKIYASKADLAAGNAIDAKIGEGITFGEDTKVIVSLILTGDYAINGYKVTNMIINDAEIASMIANMD